MISRKALLLATSLNLSIASAIPAIAEDKEANDFRAIEDIVVTATKRSTKLQNTALSISAKTGTQLENMGAQNFSDYYRTVPGLTVVDSGPQRKKYTIRGIQSDVIAGGATVGVYLDDIPGTGGIDPQLFDVDRVEVLRGPQGTLFGASAMAGIVRIITNKADPMELEVKVKGRFSSTSHGGENYGINAMVNLPLIEDKLALRVTSYYREDSGFIDHKFAGATIPGQPEIPLAPGLSLPAVDEAVIDPIDIENANSREVFGLRASLRLLATDNFTVTANFFHEKSEVHGAQNDQPLTAGEYVNSQSVLLPFELVTDIYNLSLEYDFEWANLYSTTTYLKGHVQASAEAIDIWANVIPGLTNVFSPLGTELLNESMTETFTQEVRLVSSTDGPFHVIAGLYYNWGNASLNQTVWRQQDSGLKTFGAKVSNSPRQTERAAFGELSYDVSEDIVASVGIRTAKTTVDVGPVLYTFTSPLFFLPPEGTETSKLPTAEENTLTWKFNLSYQVTDDVLLYGLASEGFRAGGSNQTIPGVVIPLTYVSDTLWNYEIGAKTSWYDERLIVNLVGYYVDWQNMQVTDFINGFGFQGNAGSAHIKGLELEMAAQPINGLIFNLSASLSDAKLAEDQPVNPNPIFITGNEGKKDDRLPGVPKVTLSASMHYDFALTDDLDGIFRVDWYYTGNSFTRFNDASPEMSELKSYSLVNARFSVKSEMDWQVDLFVDNLFNKRADLNIFNFNGGTIVHTPNQPRTIGLELTKQF
ncbi:MAG: hypothetical protein COB36_09160 [Alphaproteobacteria bacterium]|nr:MAG: hypothetical protein COB36_09160 [Alphaproteobacteria bacterium]